MCSFNRSIVGSCGIWEIQGVGGLVGKRFRFREFVKDGLKGGGGRSRRECSVRCIRATRTYAL